MALPFFFLPQYQEEDRFELDEANSRHAVAVLRMKEGEELLLTNGKGLLLRCRIIDPHKKKTLIQVLEKEQQPDHRRQVTIAISPVKNVSRFEWFLEKVTEIGLRRIRPLIAQRTEKQQFRQERMQQILISALLQSQQTWLPELTSAVKLEELLKEKSYSRKWVAHCLESEKQSLREIAATDQNQLLLIGPEGDFTPAEIDSALAAGFKPVTLGDTRLRTETAGIVGATLLCVY